jgi:hypothetical protein
MTPIEIIKEVVNQLNDNSTGDDFYGVGCAVESICRNVQLEDNDSNISMVVVPDDGWGDIIKVMKGVFLEPLTELVSSPKTISCVQNVIKEVIKNVIEEYTESDDKPTSNYETHYPPSRLRAKDFISVPHQITPCSINNGRAQILLNQKLVSKGFNEPYTCSDYIYDKNIIRKQALDWEPETVVTYKSVSNSPISSETGKSIGSILTDVDSINVKFLK